MLGQQKQANFYNPQKAFENIFKVLYSEERDEVKKLLYEYEIYNIELEAQLEELTKVKNQIQEMKREYQELFDFAPVGYIVLDENEVIKNANLFICKKLGLVKEDIINTGFKNFIAKEDSKKFSRFINDIKLNKKTPGSILRLNTMAGSKLKVLMNGASLISGKGSNIYKITITEVSDFNEVVTPEGSVIM